MRESSSDVILDLFTKESHHKNISVIFITQNVFHKGKAQRDISWNTKYLVLFKNPRDKAQIQHLARQIHHEDPAFLRDAYIDATRAPHSNLFIDLSQDCIDEFRFRANIFPDDRHCAYLPKYFKSHWFVRTPSVGKKLWPRTVELPLVVAHYHVVNIFPRKISDCLAHSGTPINNNVQR